MSGFFAVTFSVIFAYVADITEEHERSFAYGWVSLHRTMLSFFLIMIYNIPNFIRFYYLLHYFNDLNCTNMEIQFMCEVDYVII